MGCTYRVSCFYNRLVFCFYGYKTINGGVGMEVIIKKIYKAVGCEKGHYFGTFAHFKELRESSNLSVQKTCFCCGHKFQPEDFISLACFDKGMGNLVLSLDTLKKISLQISVAVLVILILKKKLLMLARSIM